MDLKAELKLILGRHEGRDKAITGKALAEMLGQRDDRAIRETIRELITDGLPVASATEPPYGYFLVMTKQEADNYAAGERSRLIEIALRRRDFRRAAACWLAPAVQRTMF